MVVIERSMPTMYIKHKGFLDVSKLVQSIKSWFKENKYTLHFPTHKFAGPIGAAEQEIKMYGERKMTEYVKFKITILMRFWDLKEVEVIKDGKKIKACTGRVAIDIDGLMALDYLKRFGGNKLLQSLQDIYHRYIIRTTIENIWDDEIFIHLVGLGKLIREQFQHEIIS